MFFCFQLYCYEVLHDHLLDILAVALDECAAAVRQDPSQWVRLEACIYAIYSVAEQIETYENKCLPKFFAILSEIPYEKLNEKLLGSVLDAIGAYSEWFKENPSYLPHAIRILVIGLNSTQTAPATLGLKDICRECQLHLSGYAEPLLQACQLALQNGRLINQDSVRLMFSIGKLMSMLPQASLLLWLDAVVSPCFTELQTITQNRDINRRSRDRTVHRLNMISTLFSAMNTRVIAHGDEQKKTDEQVETQPVLIVMQKTMPILKDVAATFIQDDAVIEALCNALKYAQTNLIDDFKPMLPDVCNLVVSILQSKCIASAIDLAKSVRVTTTRNRFYFYHFCLLLFSA